VIIAACDEYGILIHECSGMEGTRDRKAADRVNQTRGDVIPLDRRLLNKTGSINPTYDDDSLTGGASERKRSITSVAV
jgi:hypothetical protein